MQQLPKALHEWEKKELAGFPFEPGRLWEKSEESSLCKWRLTTVPHFSRPAWFTDSRLRDQYCRAQGSRLCSSPPHPSGLLIDSSCCWKKARAPIPWFGEAELGIWSWLLRKLGAQIFSQVTHKLGSSQSWASTQRWPRNWLSGGRTLQASSCNRRGLCPGVHRIGK